MTSINSMLIIFQVPTIVMTYASDICLPVGSDALLLVNALNNIVAFDFLYGVISCMLEVGFVSSFGTLADLFFAIIGLAIPLSILGQRIRRRTAQWRIVL
jgi:hypothetical protein